MSLSTVPLGAARVIRLAPDLPAYVPLALTQGTLALDLDRYSGLPLTPELRLVGGERGGVEAWAARFAQALVEVVAGDRSPHQLLRCTSPDVYDDLVRRAVLLNRAVPADQRRRRLRTQVRSVHVFSPSPGRAEVSLHVRQGERSRAVAARLDHEAGRWVCTALEFG